MKGALLCLDLASRHRNLFILEFGKMIFFSLTLDVQQDGIKKYMNFHLLLHFLLKLGQSKTR